MRVVHGPGFVPGDLPIRTSGVHLAGRIRMLLENIGCKANSRAPRTEVELYLVSILKTSGEKALNNVRDEAAALAPSLGAERGL